MLGARLIVQSEMQRHLVPLVFVGKRSTGKVHTRFAAVVHRENQSLAHVGQVTGHLNANKKDQ